MKTLKTSRFTGDAIRNQEAVFAIFMGVIVFLSRDNPDLQFPQVLWAFIIFLVFNLIYHNILSRHGKEWVVPFISVAVNCLIIAFVMSTSGGDESHFWPMFLLPIFTACVYLEERHVMLAVMIPAALLGHFYLEHLYNYEGWKLAELVIKWSVLALAAGVTMREAFKQRQAVNALRESRVELDQIARSQELDVKAGWEKKNISADQALHYLMQDMYMSLSVVWASAQILLQDTDPEASSAVDLRRILMATRSCYDLIVRSKKWIRAEEVFREDVNLGDVLNQCVALFGYQINRKRIILSKEIDARLPKLHLSQESVFQTLMGVFLAMVDLLDFKGTFSLAANAKDDGIVVHLRCEGLIPGASVKNLESCKDLFEIQCGRISIKSGKGGIECEIFFPLKG